MHRFPKEYRFEFSDSFTDPFRYSPHPSVRIAGRMISDMISCSSETAGMFDEGKMIGVLVCRDQSGTIGFLAAFSGNVGGRSCIPGFVPPIFDLTVPGGKFKTGEAEIDAINREIRTIEESDEYLDSIHKLQEILTESSEILSRLKEEMLNSKAKRNAIRAENADNGILERLIKESQFEKAEYRRMQKSLKLQTDAAQETCRKFEDRLHRLKETRQKKSESLQAWIFRQYIVHNFKGEETSIYDIFMQSGLTPPGGTGECAAPKLLEYAYRRGLTPLAMGEFWYGSSPSAPIRTNGHFYPSCTSKCGPLLAFMLKGLDIHMHETCCKSPEIVYSDNDIIVVSKPAGMPSVPGLDNRKSVLEVIQESFPDAEVVHRLDMDTSGVMIFANNSFSAVNLRRQFEEHTIKKTYVARLGSLSEGTPLISGDMGHIDLPLSLDYDERPRQKVDNVTGKSAYTDYMVNKVNDDGTMDVTFYPKTGRTHQLRIHSAHSSGLGHPIVGDLLYGSAVISSDYEADWLDLKDDSRLHLHARSISFTHPTDKKIISFEVSSDF